MNKPIFKRDDLKNFQVVDEPGTFIVKSNHTTFFEDGDKSRYLLNLRAATEEGLEECLDILGQRSYCDYDEFNDTDCFITGTLWANKVNNPIDVPTKGESVIATYDYNEEGKLRCVSITLIPRKTLKKFNPDAYNLSKQLFKDIIKNEERGDK